MTPRRQVSLPMSKQLHADPSHAEPGTFNAATGGGEPATATIRAAVLDAPEQDFSLRDLQLSAPRFGEVQVAIDAVGICHTDAVVKAGKRSTKFPAVLGHEGTGRVVALGAGVEDLTVGDRVILTYSSCGHCRQCRAAKPSYCAQFTARNFAGGLGEQRAFDSAGEEVASRFFGQSSFATLANVAERNAIKVDTDLPPALLAPVGCGILTGVGAVWNELRPEPGQAFVVYGLGAVGLSALMASKAAGCSRIVGIDTVPERLETASRLGATEVYLSGDDARLTGGFDRAVDTTANGKVFAEILGQLSPLGHVVFVGAADAAVTYPVDVKNLLLKGIQINLVVEGSSEPHRDIPRIVDAIERGVLPVQELVERYAFEEINAAFESSRTGGSIKPVLVL